MKDYDTLNENEQIIIMMEAKQRYMATALILMAELSKYGRLVEDLENKLRAYPNTVIEAYDMLQFFKQDAQNVPRLVGNSDGAQFH